MKFDRIIIKNFKCFESLTVDNLEKINVFIGKNNVGKSSILDVLDYATKNSFIPNELWRFKKKDKPEVIMIYELSDSEKQDLISKLGFYKDNQFEIFLKTLNDFYGDPLRIKRIYISPESKGKAPYLTHEFYSESDSFPNIRFTLHNKAQTHSFSLSLKEAADNISNNLKSHYSIPDFIRCGAHRRIEEIVDFLFDLRTDMEPKKTDRIDEIIKVVSSLTPDNINFDIYRENEIAFSTPERIRERIKLKHGGTGIEELIFLVTNIIENRGKIIGIEEPEIHIHPELQKRLFAFLDKESESHDTTFFITTHTNIFLNENQEGSSYHLKMVKDKTSICEKIQRSQMIEVLEELGFVFSDFYLTNGLFFVEGPTEENAFNEWAKAILNGENLSSRGIEIVTMGGARNATFFAESEVLKKLPTLPISIPFLILIDRGEKTESEIRRLKNKYKNHIKVLRNRELENYLISEGVFKGIIEERYDKYKKQEDELRKMLKDIFTESCEERKKLGLALNFLARIKDELLDQFSIIKPKSEKVWSLIKNKKEVELYPFLIEKIIQEKRLENIFSKNFVKNDCKKIWESELAQFQNKWERWNLNKKISHLPGKELLKEILNRLNKKGINLNRTLLVDYISNNINLLDSELHEILLEVSSWKNFEKVNSSPKH